MSGDGVTIFCLNNPEAYGHALDRLDDVERARAARLQQGRELFIGAHALLRYVVGPREIRTLPGGKPFFADSPLHFSLAHCPGLALCAVTAAAPVGIDAEPLIEADDGVAETVFSGRERRWIDGSAERFTELWTVKEAIFKTAGESWSEEWRERTLIPGDTPDHWVEQKRLPGGYFAALASKVPLTADWRFIEI